MRVLLTGATGYTGLVVAAGLADAGVEVRGLASRRNAAADTLQAAGGFTLHQADLSDLNALPDALAMAVDGVDAVVHLAAVVGDPASARAPELARQVNVQATQVLLEAAERADVRQFVFASTCSVYGRHTAGEATETTPPNPVSLYGETKVEAEQHLLQHARGVDVAVLRLATAYGVSPRMRLDLVVNHFVQQATSQGRITVMGPDAWRPHVHVNDIAHAVGAVLAEPAGTRGQIFNVVTENMRLREVAALAADVQPHPVRIDYRAQVDDRRDYAVSGDRLRALVGYTPGWTVAQGVTQIRDHLVDSPPSPGHEFPDSAPTTGRPPAEARTDASAAARQAAWGFPQSLRDQLNRASGASSQAPPPLGTNRPEHRQDSPER